MLHINQVAHYKYEYQVQMTVGGTQAALTSPASPVANPENIFVQAHPSNTGNIVIGKTGVAADGSAGGYVLSAGSNMNLGKQEASEYYAIATASDQKLQITYQRGAL